MNKILISKRLWCHILLLLFFMQMYSQCPISFPQSNDWGTWNRVIYDGNWLLNSAGTAYVSTPNRSAIAPTTSNSSDFGVDDISSDVNFNSPSFAPPLSTTTYSVGRKFVNRHCPRNICKNNKMIECRIVRNG